MGKMSKWIHQGSNIILLMMINVFVFGGLALLLSLTRYAEYSSLPLGLGFIGILHLWIIGRTEGQNEKEG